MITLLKSTSQISQRRHIAARQTEGQRGTGLSGDFMKSLELKKMGVNHNVAFCRIQRAIGSLLLSSVSMTAMAEGQKAETQWYQADMIVFLNEQSMNSSEKWPEITTHSLPANAIKLKSSDSVKDAGNLTNRLGQSEKKPEIDLERDAFVSLPYPSQLLQKESSALSRNGSYRILEQKAWLMPIKDGKSTKPVTIRTYTTQSKKPGMLEGTVTVSSSRYLHVKVNLWYSELAWEALAKNMGGSQPNPDSQKKPTTDGKLQLVTTPDGQTMKISRNFHMQESRRITNIDEVQYLDSPVIGVLFKLTPYEKPDKPSLPEMESDQDKSPELGILPGIFEQEDS